MSKWVSINERRPENEQEVLVTLKEGSEAFGGYIYGKATVVPAIYIDDETEAWYPHFELCDGSNLWHVENVLAWMPMPEPYKVK